MRKKDVVTPGLGSTRRAQTIEKQLPRMRKKNGDVHDYTNCFILGSVAEVERLWSIAKYVLTVNRRLMTPQLFEALVVLKVNERYWDAQLVSKATYSARRDRAEASLCGHDEHMAQNI